MYAGRDVSRVSALIATDINVIREGVVTANNDRSMSPTRAWVCVYSWLRLIRHNSAPTDSDSDFTDDRNWRERNSRDHRAFRTIGLTEVYCTFFKFKIATQFIQLF